MRLLDKIAEIFDRGYTIMEGFIDAETKRSEDVLWTIQLRSEEYFADL